jgi:hypothetical protein
MIIETEEQPPDLTAKFKDRSFCVGEGKGRILGEIVISKGTDNLPAYTLFPAKGRQIAWKSQVK